MTNSQVLGGYWAWGVRSHAAAPDPYFVADVKPRLPCQPECGRVFVRQTGSALTSPLPEDRWLIFVNRDETDTRRALPTEGELGAMLNPRTGVDVGLSDLRRVSQFNMHRRAVERLSDGGVPC